MSNTLYVGGCDSSGNHQGVYWTITTNGGLLTENVVIGYSTSGSILRAIAFDPNGNLWLSGIDALDYPGYWSNGVETVESSDNWINTYNIVFSGTNFYTSYYCNSTGESWIFINGVEYAVTPQAAYYLGGMAVNNGIIYITGNYVSGNGYVWISSNNCTNYISISLGTGTGIDINGAPPCYSGSLLYVPGYTQTTTSYPCYWTVDGSGNVVQTSLNYISGTASANTSCLTVTNNTVYTVGWDNNQPVYWIGTNEYILDSSGSAFGLVGTY
jgi:hypothetical protein